MKALAYIGLAALLALPATASAQAPKKGGTLVYAIGAETPTYDCSATDTYAGLHFLAPFYSTLLKFDLAAYPKVMGDLAESWTISPDKKTYTFHLNPEAKWSDGKPVTAQDVQFYYDVMMNPKNLTSLFRVDLARFARPEVVDDRTVRIKAEEAHWKNFWAAGGFMALPKHVWEGKDFNEINFEFPVVSGPYRLYRNLTNRSITMQRRGDWWGRNLKINLHKYNFDYLVFRAEEDRTKALEMLKRGDFDLYPIYTSRIWVEQTPEIPQVKKNWIVRQIVYNQEPKSFQGFALNLRRPLFQDIRVREALARVLNRELMLDKIMFNQYFLLNNYYPDLYPDNRNPDAPLLSYNPDRARALLAEAGWSVDKADGVLKKDGKAFELVILYSGEPLPHYNIYLEDLKAVGIDRAPRLAALGAGGHAGQQSRFAAPGQQLLDGGRCGAQLSHQVHLRRLDLLLEQLDPAVVHLDGIALHGRIQHVADGLQGLGRVARLRGPDLRAEFELPHDLDGSRGPLGGGRTHRHLFRFVGADRVLLGETPRDRLRFQPLVRQRHANAPTERRKRPRLLGTDQFEQF